MNSQKSSLQQKYRICSCISLALILLGQIGAAMCNYFIGSAYLGFIVCAVLYASAVVYQLIITVKAYNAAKKAALSQLESQELNRYTFRLCSLVMGCAVVQTVVCFPLITMPWMFSQRIIALGWLENAWLPGLIAIGICIYLWWFLDTTAIIKGFWQRLKVSKKEKNERQRYLLYTVIALLAVLLGQIIFNGLSIDTLAGGNTYHNWDDFVAFMELPQDEWGNIVDRSLDEKTSLYSLDGQTLLCKFFRMNESVHHLVYGDSAEQLPVIVYTNLQMDDAAALQKNVNLFFYALYVVVPLATLGYYLWKQFYQKKQPAK